MIRLNNDICLMDKVFQEHRDYVENYHDDVYCMSQDAESHILHIENTLEALIKANLQVSAEKCNLFRKKLKVLGHEVGQNTISPDSSKTEAISKMSKPINRKGVRSFLGMCSFFRKFIKYFAPIARPLTFLTSDNVLWT